MPKVNKPYGKITGMIIVSPRTIKAVTWLMLSLATLSIASGVLEALPYGSGSYGTCSYSTCSITISTSGTIALSATPTASGVYTIASDTVTVGTDASTGYTLSMKDADTTTNLVSGPNTIAASSGTPASPVALTLNTWGWRIDALAGFGNGPTTTQNSVANSTLTFAGAVASNQGAQTLRTKSSAANPAEATTVWFGVRVDTSKPSGTYTDQITYTAVTND